MKYMVGEGREAMTRKVERRADSKVNIKDQVSQAIPAESCFLVKMH
jgi:hypothetical protein